MGDRHAVRPQWTDNNDGLYHVTICVANNRHLLGEIRDCQMILSPAGVIVNDCIKRIELHHPYAEVWNYVVMPSHVHLLLNIKSDGKTKDTANTGCLRPSRHGEQVLHNHHNSLLAVTVGSFKSACSREIHRAFSEVKSVWQSRFYEEEIRNAAAYRNVMEYIDANVENWEADPCG